MTITETSDNYFMQRALKLAQRGIGKTSPNPMVGAVIVQEGNVIAEGYHHYFGGVHAEIDAIHNATAAVAGATMYVTLEPCHHYGKTPPCVDALIKHRFGRVVIGMADPDSRVAGRSIRKLEEHGILTTVGVLEDECRALNESYIKHRTTGLPFVTLKWAQSLDGRIATVTGDSRWISSPESRKLAHRLRAHHDAVLVGVGTVLADNPELTVRSVSGRNPLRVVLDSRLRIPQNVKLLTDANRGRTMIVTTDAADEEKAARLRESGVKVLTVPADDNEAVSLKELLVALGEGDITSVLVEGGSTVITRFLAEGLADKLVVFIAPKIIGTGKPAVGDLDINEIVKALPLTIEKTYRRGSDIVVEVRPPKL